MKAVLAPGLGRRGRQRPCVGGPDLPGDPRETTSSPTSPRGRRPGKAGVGPVMNSHHDPRTAFLPTEPSVHCGWRPSPAPCSQEPGPFPHTHRASMTRAPGQVTPTTACSSSRGDVWSVRARPLVGRSPGRPGCSWEGHMVPGTHSAPLWLCPAPVSVHKGPGGSSPGSDPDSCGRLGVALRGGRRPVQHARATVTGPGLGLWSCAAEKLN